MSTSRNYGRMSNRSNNMDRKKRKDCCKTCGSHDSACNCKSKAPSKKVKPLTGDCALVNSVVCSKKVQKVAEAEIPLALFTLALDPAEVVSIDVVPDLTEITNNVRVIKGKVVNIGTLPVAITVRTTLPTPLDVITLPIVLTFQEHTNCPGACPEDTVTETPLQVEGVFVQQGIEVLSVGPSGGAFVPALLPGILVKVILRTTLTVTRPVMVDKHGNFCDVNPNRCDNGTPTFILPPPNGN